MFLLVSDDMRWVKTRIFERTKSKYDIFLAGNGHGDELFEVGKYLNSFQIISISKWWYFIRMIRKSVSDTSGLYVY